MVRESIQAGTRSDFVWKIFGQCEAEDGAETDPVLQASAGWHKGIQQDAKGNSHSRRRRSPCKRGRLKSQRRGSRDKNIRGFSPNLRWKVSCRKNGCGIFAREKI